MPQDLLWLALAGALGTLARFGMSELVAHLAGRKFPWSTLTINVLGSLLFGLVWTLASERQWISERTGLIVLTGFMGAFTTYSTFAFETEQLLVGAKWELALSNLLAQNGLAVLAVVAGCRIARWM
ncbi:MAG: fluoride efflux transporter CrcB [Planctomycetaceae bacterium]|nr:fluoride efflux transporter CrcB [Planctomycetaceae bacterium]